MPLLLDIVITFMKIGVLAFGGGYAAVPLVEEQVVTVKRWMTAAEFADILAIDELTPGPIIINAATFVGTRTAGVPGAVAATLGSVLPSLVLALLLGKVYSRLRGKPVFDGILDGLKAMVTGLIAAAAFTASANAFLPSGPDPVAIGIAAAAFLVLRVWRPDPVVAVLGGGAAGLLLYSLLG